MELSQEQLNQISEIETQAKNKIKELSKNVLDYQKVVSIKTQANKDIEAVKNGTYVASV